MSTAWQCSRCHHTWQVEGEDDPHACPNCKAEAGLHVEYGMSASMKLFGLLLGGSIVAAVVGTALTWV